MAAFEGCCSGTGVVQSPGGPPACGTGDGALPQCQVGICDMPVPVLALSHGHH